MLHQSRLDLEGADPDAADLQHVVGAAGVGEASIGVADVFVAASHPRALEGLARPGPVAPVHERRRGPPDVQVARLAVRNGASVLGAEFDLVAPHRPAGRAVAHLVGAVGDEDVQHLGRTDPIDDVDAEMALEALADLGGQRFAGRRHESQAHLLALRQKLRSEHAGEAGRRAVEGGGHDVADAAAQAPEHRLRRRPLGHEQRGRADAERKGERVAEAIGEEKLGGGEADVALVQAQDRLAVKLGRPIGIGVRMHGPLGPAGRTGRIEPEGRIVGVGAGGPGQGRRAAEEILERDLVRLKRLDWARDDDRVDLVIRLGERGFQRRLDRAADERGLGARMFQHIGEIVGGEQRVDRDRDGAREHRPQEGDRPVEAILHQDQRALLAPDASILQSCGETARAIVEFAIGQRAEIVDEGRLAGAPGIDRKEMAREVERLRRRLDRAHGHRRLLPSQAGRE